MLRVILESPYAGDTADRVQDNVKYARLAMAHSLNLGEAPMASHLLYPQVLNDKLVKERDRGINAGYEWMQAADLVVFYTDRGWSPGMVKALKIARLHSKRIALRQLYLRHTAEPLEVKELISHLRAAGQVYQFDK